MHKKLIIKLLDTGRYGQLIKLLNTNINLYSISDFNTIINMSMTHHSYHVYDYIVSHFPKAFYRGCLFSNVLKHSVDIVRYKKKYDVHLNHTSSIRSHIYSHNWYSILEYFRYLTLEKFVKISPKNIIKELIYAHVNITEILRYILSDYVTNVWKISYDFVMRLVKYTYAFA
jgi:5'(3')-deoxyribonucleotidase